MWRLLAVTMVSTITSFAIHQLFGISDSVANLQKWSNISKNIGYRKREIVQESTNSNIAQSKLPKRHQIVLEKLVIFNFPGIQHQGILSITHFLKEILVIPNHMIKFNKFHRIIMVDHDIKIKITPHIIQMPTPEASSDLAEPQAKDFRQEIVLSLRTWWFFVGENTASPQPSTDSTSHSKKSLWLKKLNLNDQSPLDSYETIYFFF